MRAALLLGAKRELASGRKLGSATRIGARSLLTAEPNWANRDASGKASYGRSLYNFQRDYDPATGRYLTADPIGLNERIARALDPSADRRRLSLELTPYAYANGNPTLFIDPTGMYGWIGALGGAASNLSLQFLTNLASNGGDAANALYCVDLADVAISAAVGAVAPSFFSNVLGGKPGPFGHTRLQNFKLFIPAFAGGAAAKKLAPEYPIGDPCKCKEAAISELIKDFFHGF
jgi:RHS repeat-associated protein